LSAKSVEINGCQKENEAMVIGRDQNKIALIPVAILAENLTLVQLVPSALTTFLEACSWRPSNPLTTSAPARYTSFLEACS
jgi:hypothetical protein